MKTYRYGVTLVILFILLVLALGAQAAETVKEYPVTLEHEIQGILVEPQRDSPVPAVLLLHGFASQKDEVGEMYKRLAAALGEQGIASLRIDFRGWGESGGEMSESTIQGQVADAAAAYNYLRVQEFVDSARIGVVGFSLGGGIAIVSAAQQPEWYKSMVLWSSVGNFKADFLEVLGQENFERAAKEGIVTIDLGWRQVTLGNGFFTSLDLYDLQQEISRYPGAFLTITGSEDFAAAYSEGYLSRVKGAPKEAWTIEGTGHIFGVLDDDRSIANSVIAKTVQWSQDTL